MEFALQPHLYRNVPVIFWPWVFWQLLQIMRWAEWFGRDVTVAVAATGHVYVTRMSDDPEAPRAWAPDAPTLSPWARMANSCCAVQAWPPHAGRTQPKPIAPPTPAPAINDSS